MIPNEAAVAGIFRLKSIAARFRRVRCVRCRERMLRTKGGSKCPRCGARYGFIKEVPNADGTRPVS